MQIFLDVYINQTHLVLWHDVTYNFNHEYWSAES